MTLKNEQLNDKNLDFKLIIIYLTVGLVAFFIRLYFNFSQNLIPGVNGGYYPLQVRYVLTNGKLGFSDMPLLFYLDAFLIKIVSLFGFTITDTLILNVVKLVDSFSIPLLLIPLYKIVNLSRYVSLKYFDISIIAFSVLSFSPLILTSDLQKNALAIVFLFGFIAYFLNYLIKKEKFDIPLSIAFLLLTGLTHFGTFAFALFFLLISALYFFKKKAIIPLAIVIAVSSILVAIFDLSRFNRLFSFWTELFERPAIFGILTGAIPPDFLSPFLGIFGIIILKTKRNKLTLYQKTIMFSSIVCLIAFSFPFLEEEYFKRLSLLLFIPQILLILQIAPTISIRLLKIISISLLVFTFLSIFLVSGHPKETVLDTNAFENLKELNPIIESNNETIIIARHGLEWWIAWALHTKIGQDKLIDKALFEKYKNIIFIVQISDFGNDKPRPPLHGPIVPQNSELIFTSDYFKAFRLKH